MPDPRAGDAFGIDLFPVSCLVTDGARKIVFANAHAAGHLDRPCEQLIGLSLEAVLTPASRIFCDSYIYPILLTEGRVDEMALTIATGSGARAPILVNACVHDQAPGLVLWSFLSADRRQKLEEELVASRNLLQKRTLSLKQLATRDDLTGLMNRREATRMIGQLISDADRAGVSVTIALLDIDRFKAINDTYGHAAGDDVLRQMGAAFADTVRRHEIAGRYGGEEFIFALSAADAEAARPFSRRLHAAVASVTGSGAPVTASIGLCCRPPRSSQPLDESLQAADQALYRAKDLGRNRSMLAGKDRFLPFD